MKLAIVDLGIGNILNVRRAFEEVGADIIICQNAKDIMSAERLVLPGVGAFENSVSNLLKQRLLDAIHGFLELQRPLLGICIGMHLLMEGSEESPGAAGTAFIEGGAVHLSKLVTDAGTRQRKIPHAGWSRTFPSAEPGSPAATLFNGLSGVFYSYYCHSYAASPVEPAVEVAYGEFGEDRFVSMIAKHNVFGCQFHPEKSGPDGLKFLSNFLKV